MAAKNLLLTGGCFHPFEESSATLADVLADADIESEITDVADGLARLGSAQAGHYPLLTVYALRWRMLHPRFEDERPRWSFSLPASGRDAIRAHLRAGGGILALHTAAICFDDWSEWRDIVGASWSWDRSFHPPPRRSRVEVAATAHPIVDGLSGFEVEDEVYSFLDWAPDARPLASCRQDGVDQPLVAARDVAGGRAVYDALGHDGASLRAPTHQTLLRRAARWALGDADQQVRSTR